jgi:hypothetical protein
VAGTQDALAKEAGHNLWQARADLEAAKKAPNNGSVTQDALRRAQTKLTEAQTAFNRRYGEYLTSMTNAHQTPSPQESFIIQR